jgi:diguanylate cyclase (GGDEF)-like protein
MSTVLQPPAMSPTPDRDQHAVLLSALWAQAGVRLHAMSAVKEMESGRYRWADPALAALLGRSQDALLGRTDADWADAETAAALRAADLTAFAREGVSSSEHRIDVAGERQDLLVLRLGGAAGPAGQRLLASVWIDQRAIRQKDAQLRQAIEQIEQLQQANEALRLELADQGLRDRDSGLYSRSHFDEQVRREVDLSTREHREFALVFIEVDPPSDKAAALGARARARVCEALGRLLQSNTRAMDASCRLDERRFAVLLSGVGLATAHSRMEGLRRQCATQIVVVDGQDLGFSISMGVASFPHTAHSQEELLGACEAALAEARRRGGNQVTLASIRFEP